MNAAVLVIRGLGARWLGCYGNEWIATPNLDRLAAAGEVYDRHYVRSIADPLPAAGGPPQILHFNDLPKLAERWKHPGWWVIDGLQKLCDPAMPAADALERFTAAVEELDAALAPIISRPWDIVFTSDGGLSVGEHGRVGRAGPPHEELVHIPLIVRRASGANAGARHLKLTTAADFAVIFSGNLPARNHVASFHDGCRSLRTADWTLVEMPQPCLFRFPHDRFEQCDLARIQEAEVERLTKLLDGEI